MKRTLLIAACLVVPIAALCAVLRSATAFTFKDPKGVNTIRFTLDDSSAMSPASRLSSAAQVVVGARISKSGNATPQPGDLQGFSQPVAVGASGLAIEIAEEVK